MKPEKMEKQNLPSFAAAKMASSSFFKVFVPEHSRWQIEIPEEFVRDALTEKPEIMVLHCRSGRGSWNAEVVEGYDGGIYLRNGWEKFVEDNLLVGHEFLVFKYDGSTRLDVQIFKKNGLERKMEAATSAAAGLQSLDRKKRKEDNGASRDDRIRSFKNKTKYYFFERRIKPYNVRAPFTLFIPKDFGEEHLPPGSMTEIKLRNEEGETWEVNCSKNGPQNVLVGGWRKFASDNSLNAGDVCIFELVGKTTFRVNKF